MPRNPNATPTPIAALVQNAFEQARPLKPWGTLSQRLERTFGLGERPLVRRRLYGRLQRLCDEHGSTLYRHVCSVASAAKDKQEPSNWFCRAVMLRLKDCGYDI
jgi:hypothetical protein